MDSDIKKFGAELHQFKQTTFYKHLEKRVREKMRSRMARLIDYALNATDDRIRAVAQSIREEAIFWSEIRAIEGVKEVRPTSGAETVEMMFRDYDQPDVEVEVGLPTGS